MEHTGDGSLSVFEGPARAARWWVSIASWIVEIEIFLRGGLHTSELEVVDADVRGLGVHVAARLMGLGSPGELIVSPCAGPFGGTGLDSSNGDATY